MLFWRPFFHRGVSYDLSHLHPSFIKFIQPGNANQPERLYKVNVSYSVHCFSRKDDSAEPSLSYSDIRETRTFDFVRYELSKRLPEIIGGLHTRKCLHSGKGNFFVIETIAPDGDSRDYEVYFKVSKAETAGIINLYVQSAYIRDIHHKNRPINKKIGFFVILHNKLVGKEIKIPK